LTIRRIAEWYEMAIEAYFNENMQHSRGFAEITIMLWILLSYSSMEPR